MAQTLLPQVDGTFFYPGLIPGAPSGPAFQSNGGWTNANSSTSLVLTMPASSKGQLLIAVIMCCTGTNIPTALAGWTTVLSQTNVTMSIYIAARYASASEPGTYTWTTVGTQDFLGSITNYGTGFIDSLLNTPFNRFNTANTTHAIQSMTATLTPGHDGLLVEIWAGNSGALAGTETWSITTNLNSATIRNQKSQASQGTIAIGDAATTAYTATANGDTATSTSAANLNDLIGIGLILI